MNTWIRPKSSRQAFALGAALVTLAGCGSSPVPVERVASSEAAIRAAQEVGAGQHPQAALHLKLAQEQFEQAKAMINDGKNERAEMVLRRAEADAELAVALARENSTKTEAQKLLEQVQEAKKKAL
jgi:hypothetical protein